MKKTLFLIFSILFFKEHAQNLSGIGLSGNAYSFLNEKNKNGIGYSIDVKHFYAFRFFCAEFNGSFVPVSNYGFVQKYFLGAGFTSSVRNRVSWHATIGEGILLFKNEAQISEPDKNLMYSKDPTIYLETGGFYHLSDSSRHTIGIRLFIYEEHRLIYKSFPQNTYSPSIQISYNIRF